MVDVNYEDVQRLSQQRFGLDFPGGLRAATGVNLDYNGICRLLFGKEFNSCHDELISVMGQSGLVLPGTAGAFISTPDTADLDIVGDLDIRCEFFSSSVGIQTLVGKWGAAQQSYAQTLVPAFAACSLQLSTTGANDVGALMVGGATGLRTGALRTTIDVDDGGGQRIATLYSAPTMDGPWTPLVVQPTAGAIALFPGSASLCVGALNATGANPFQGRITRAQVRAGIDGAIVANPDMRLLAPGTTSFPDSTGRTWTVNGGSIV